MYVFPSRSYGECSYFIKSMFLSPVSFCIAYSYDARHSRRLYLWRVGDDNFSSHKTSAVNCPKDISPNFVVIGMRSFADHSYPSTVHLQLPTLVANVLLTGVPT